MCGLILSFHKVPYMLRHVIKTFAVIKPTVQRSIHGLEMSETEKVFFALKFERCDGKWSGMCMSFSCLCVQGH